MKRHETTHSDERAHKCDLCNTSFKRRAHLLRHFKLSHRKEDLKKEMTDNESGGTSDIPLVSDIKQEQNVPLHNNLPSIPPHPIQNNDNKIDNLPFYNYNTTMQKSNSNLLYSNNAQYNNVQMLQPHATQLQHPGVLHSPQHHLQHQHRNNHLINHQYGSPHHIHHPAQQQSLQAQHPHHHQQQQSQQHSQHNPHHQIQPHQHSLQQQPPAHAGLHPHHHLQHHQAPPQQQQQQQQQPLPQHQQQYHHPLPGTHQQHHYNQHHIQQPSTPNWQNVSLGSTSTSTATTPANTNPVPINNYHQNVDRNNRFMNFMESEPMMEMNNPDLLQYQVN